jgi:hypothetical protein
MTAWAGLPSSHAERLVSENLPDQIEVLSFHHSPRRCRMAKRVERGVHDAELMENPATVDTEFLSVHPGKHQTARPAPRQALQHLHRASPIRKIRLVLLFVSRRVRSRLTRSTSTQRSFRSFPRLHPVHAASAITGLIHGSAASRAALSSLGVSYLVRPSDCFGGLMPCAAFLLSSSHSSQARQRILLRVNSSYWTVPGLTVSARVSTNLFTLPLVMSST